MVGQPQPPPPPPQPIDLSALQYPGWVIAAAAVLAIFKRELGPVINSLWQAIRQKESKDEEYTRKILEDLLNAHRQQIVDLREILTDQQSSLVENLDRVLSTLQQMTISVENSRQDLGLLIKDIQQQLTLWKQREEEAEKRISEISRDQAAQYLAQSRAINDMIGKLSQILDRLNAVHDRLDRAKIGQREFSDH